MDFDVSATRKRSHVHTYIRKCIETKQVNLAFVFAYNKAANPSSILCLYSCVSCVPHTVTIHFIKGKDLLSEPIETQSLEYIGFWFFTYRHFKYFCLYYINRRFIHLRMYLCMYVHTCVRNPRWIRTIYV